MINPEDDTKRRMRSYDRECDYQDMDFITNEIIHKFAVRSSSLTAIISLDFKKKWKKKPSDRLFVKHIDKDVIAVRQNDMHSRVYRKAVSVALVALNRGRIDYRGSHHYSHHQRLSAL